MDTAVVSITNSFFLEKYNELEANSMYVVGAVMHFNVNERMHGTAGSPG
jgi:hypothetical protein